MEDNGRTKSLKKFFFKNLFLKAAGDHLGTLVGVPMAQKIKSNKKIQLFSAKKNVIERYGHQSISIDLIKHCRTFFNRHEENKTIFLSL